MKFQMASGHDGAAFVVVMRLASISFVSIRMKASIVMRQLEIRAWSFCSKSTAPLRRMIEAAFGSIPTTSARRLASLSRPWVGVVECSLARF